MVVMKVMEILSTMIVEMKLMRAQMLEMTGIKTRTETAVMMKGMMITVMTIVVVMTAP
jgi:hypothetical protein